MKQKVIDLLKDPEVAEILQEHVLAPVVQRAVNAAVAARDEEIRQLKTEIASQKQVINDLEQYSRKKLPHDQRSA